jgi:hypothetical protein
LAILEIVQMFLSTISANQNRCEENELKEERAMVADLSAK